ncbi:LysE family translocator [Pseudomonas sp. IT-P294]|jgi:threonine/homoserine/homoserine lactone efflux protein|uniref:LysE family translocator n=1 Tax=Pseudomonas sp. IT-P294 TaxID=3026454 RepID=UPI0039E16401
MLSTFPTLLPFLLFAFVASITPGPTNILVLSTSARHGFKAALPIVFGACSSAALMVLLVGSGLGSTLHAHPVIHATVYWAGIAWLNYLGWRIFWSPSVELNSQSLPSGPRLGFWSSAGLQWINPKSWMMALAVISVFTAGGGDKAAKVQQLSLLFFLIALPCLGAWAALGSGTGHLLRSDRARSCFNRTMGVLLIAAAWLPAFV